MISKITGAQWMCCFPLLTRSCRPVWSSYTFYSWTDFAFSSSCFISVMFLKCYFTLSVSFSCPWEDSCFDPVSLYRAFFHTKLILQVVYCSRCNENEMLQELILFFLVWTISNKWSDEQQWWIVYWSRSDGLFSDDKLDASLWLMN